MAAALAVLTILVFSCLPNHDFLAYDDQMFIIDNAAVRAGLTWEGARLAFFRSYGGNWHPLTWLSHMADAELFGLDPRGHHATSLLLHALTVSLLHLVLVALTGAAGPSAFAAALFAVHPLHVESVAWVSARKDVLCGLFWVLTIAAYIGLVRRPGKGRGGWVVVAFSLCLMAKPMGMTLPVILLALDFWPLGRLREIRGSPTSSSAQSFRRSWGLLILEKTPLLLLAALCAVMTWTARSRIGTVVSLDAIPVDVRLANAILSFWSYLGKAIAPARLAAYYPFPDVRLTDGGVLLGAGALLAATVAVIRLRRLEPQYIAGWIWFLFGLAPVIGVVQVGEQAMADRYTYLPLVGPFLAVGWGATRLGRSSGRRLFLTAVAAVILLLSAMTWRQTTYWRNTETLFAHALLVTEGNWFAHNNYAGALFMQGRVEEAAAHLEESLRLRPDYRKARLNLERVLEELRVTRRTTEARQPPAAARPR